MTAEQSDGWGDGPFAGYGYHGCAKPERRRSRSPPRAHLQFAIFPLGSTGQRANIAEFLDTTHMVRPGMGSIGQDYVFLNHDEMGKLLEQAGVSYWRNTRTDEAWPAGLPEKREERDRIRRDLMFVAVPLHFSESAMK